MACPTVPSFIRGCDFANYLVNQTPVYDKLILADIRPSDGWIGHVSTGTWDNYTSTARTQNKFTNVFPDVTAAWTQVPTSPNCSENPCDKTEHCIGWGNDSKEYYLEEQSWATPILCYDQIMHVTAAKAHFRQIIGEVLKPATSFIMSNFLRKRAVTVGCGNSWVADATMTGIAGAAGIGAQFAVDGTGAEVFFETTAMPTSKLTPQMLQRRVMPLMAEGYHGKDPFKGKMPPLMELVTDMETAWDLDKLACGGGPSIANNWRFTQFSAANEYWRYGFGGQLGNFGVRVDPFQLRFFYAGEVGGFSRFRVVLPYTNAAATNGLQSQFNEDYLLAPYAISFIWHKKAMECLVADASPVNPEMPFSSRNFGGQWKFAMNDLGQDTNGRVIENKRGNKGQFIADFKMAIRPLYTELADCIFHLREPSCITTCEPCTQYDYPAQTYDSCNDACA